MTHTSAIIGYTGFVGSNLNSQYNFDCKYNSKNIEDIADKSFDLIVCAGAPGEKWLANKFPENDAKSIEELISNLTRVETKLFVLISTVDVYKSPKGVDENTPINKDELDTYGKNRYLLEKFVEKKFDNYVIVRLPGLFGENIKKNLIYDAIFGVPSVFPLDKFTSLLGIIKNDNDIKLFEGSYFLDNYSNMRLKKGIKKPEMLCLKNILKKINYDNFQFTDSDSIFQFYYLKHLWEDISFAIKNGIKLINFATEPIAVSRVMKECFGIGFINHTDKGPVYYDMRSIYSKAYSDQNIKPYLFSQDEIISQINEFNNQ